nr:MAG TPA: hypothetical protein [Caudoviricetes sp.]
MSSDVVGLLKDLLLVLLILGLAYMDRGRKK